MRDDGTVKLLDFGLAKAMDPTSGGSADMANSPTITAHGTQAGTILGTAAYMSPEQAAGKLVDKRSDLWAFGVVLLEMLTGRAVFEGETVSHVLAAVLTMEPDWTGLPANTPTSIKRLLHRCLEKDRKRRLADAADARLEIEDAPAEATSAASPDITRRRVAPVLIGSAIGTAVIVTLAMLVWLRPAPVDSLPLTRLRVDLGPEADNGTRTTVAISPDGRRIVFPIRGANGIRQLATRVNQ